MENLREFAPALKFVFGERLTKGDLPDVEVGKAARSALGMDPSKNDGGNLGTSFVAALGRTTHWADVWSHMSASAATFIGLYNLHGPGATYNHVMKPVMHLEDRKLIEFERAKPNAHLRGTGQTLLKGNDDLCEALADFGQKYIKSPSVTMKEFGGAYCAPPKNAEYEHKIAELNRVDHMIAGMKINLAACGQITGGVLRASKVFLPCAPAQAQRAFEENSYELGGTIISPFQKLEISERKRIELDGAPVVEIMIKDALASQCYSMLGAHVGAAPYQISGYHENLVAAGFEACLDALELIDAIKAVQRSSYLGEAEATLLVIELIEMHPFLKDMFFKGKGAEIRNKESNMMIEAVIALLDADIPSLPLRSSIIVPANFRRPAEDVMTRCLARAYPGSRIQLEVS